MTEKLNSTEWRIIGETVPGASHLRAGIPNQDAILQLRESSRALPLVLTVSDGHGSPKCFRSHIGSRYAVKKSAALVAEFLDARRGGDFDLLKLETEGKEFLPPEFVSRWRAAVAAHLEKNPFTDEEFKKLEEKSGAEAVRLVEENPYLAYGATSLTAAVEENFMLYLQLGDGDILLVSEKGEVTRALPDDERLFANETTSLCLPQAEKDFRFFVQEISAGRAPALVMLSTDGYVNSFSEEAGFLKAGSDFFELLGTEGHDFIDENLKTWLEETTATGSGDDTTVGIVYRPDAVKKSVAAGEPEIASAEAAPDSKAKPADDRDFPPPTENMPENTEDVTVTIRIKKDKNKASADVETNVQNNQQEAG